MAVPENVRNGRKAKLTSNDSGLFEAAHRFWQKSYAGDYLGLVLLLAAYLFIKFWGEPFHQMFRLSDPRIQHPHAEVERVSVFWLFTYAAGIPLTTLILWTLLWRPDLHKAHITLLGLCISVTMTLFLTDILKNAIGRPRPDLLARCTPHLTTPKDSLVTIEICTESDHHRLHDGWRSFPSGHSSFSFSGLGWLALFFASQTHVLRPRASLIVLLLCLAPLLGAALIAISRLEDYRHDVADVLAGSALGFGVAYFNWRRYYPCLWGKMCDEPYRAAEGSGRGSPGGGFQRVRDEEEGFGVDGGERFSIGDEGVGFRRDSER